MQIVHDTRTDLGPLMERYLKDTLYPDALGEGPYMVVRLPRDRDVFEKLVETAEGGVLQGYALERGVLVARENTGVVVGRPVLLCGVKALPLAEYSSGVDFAIKQADFGVLDVNLRNADLGKTQSLPESCDWGPMDMLVMTPGIQMVKEDVDFFLSHPDWYAQRKFPFRLSFLLYGAPGNGKSSCIRALAEGLDAPVKTFQLGNPKMSDSEFEEWFFGQSDAFEVKVLEDLDRYFTPSAEKAGTGVTLPCIQNCLDGVRQVENMILFGTANHPEWFDAQVLVRPGRFNRRIEFPPPSEEAILRYFRKYAGEQDTFAEEELVILARDIATGAHSYAMLYAICMGGASRAFSQQRPNVLVEDLAAVWTHEKEQTKFGARMGAQGRTRTGFTR